MSNLFSPAKSSIELTGQQCGRFQAGFSGSSAVTSVSSSDAFSSNARQASVWLANKTDENAPATVAEAGAIVNQNRSIRTAKPYYHKKDGDIKTWSNMTVKLEEDASKSNDDEMVLDTEGDTFQTEILAVQGCIAGQEIQDLIVDTGSPVSFVSSQFYETIINGTQLQPIKGQYIAVNGSLLNIIGSVELTITLDKIEITQKFLCVDTKLFLALLGYNFLRKNKVDILTSANCLLIQNVQIITHMHKRRNKVREYIERDISSNKIDKMSFKDEAPLLNELPNATAVATVAAPEVTHDAALIDTSAPTQQSADKLSLQLTDSDKSKVPNAMSLFLAKPHETVFVNIAKPEPTVAGFYSIEPVALQRHGKKRYDQRPRLKPSIRDAFIVIKESILILLLIAGYSPFSLAGAIDRNIKNTLNNWASMASVLIRQFGTTLRVCGRTGIGRDFVVVAGLRAALCKNRQGTAEWILLPTAKSALYSGCRCAGCINVTFDKALLLRWSTCFGTTRVAQWINLLPTRYISQKKRSLVLIISVAIWSLPPWESGNDELVRTLPEVQRLACSQAEAVANVTSEQVSARQLLNDKSNKTIINQISMVSQCAHPLTVVALAIVLVALFVTIASFVSVNPMLKLFWVTITAVLFLGSLRCNYTKYIDDAANQVEVVSALRGKHKHIEYRACLMQNQTLEMLETQVIIIIQNTGMARLDYGPQQITEFTYGLMRQGLFIADVVKSTTTKCDCSFNDDKKFALSTNGILDLTSRQPPDKSTLTLR